MDKIEDKVDQIRDDISVIKSDLRSHLTVSYMQAKSPISLTPEGWGVAKEIDAERRISENWDRIRACIEEGVPDKNAYDIQEFCINRATISLLEFLSEKDLRDMKLIAFKKGKPVEAFAGVIAIIIRDTYFKEKGIEVDDRADSQARI
jgi:hypothetical protein